MRCATLLLALVIACLLAGCSPTTAPPMNVASLPADQQKVVQIAATFLKTNSKSWGTPSAVEPVSYNPRTGEKTEGFYLVKYPTTLDEVKLIGERIVIVHADTQQASFMPRR